MYTTHISYLEIYNECGYDLLDPRHEASSLEDLPLVAEQQRVGENDFQMFPSIVFFETLYVSGLNHN